MVIGIGGDFRRDDGVGPAIVRRLAERKLPGVACLEAESDALALLEIWRGADAVLLIDAVCSGAEPGTISRLDLASRPLPASFAPVSTHGLGLREAIELASLLDRLPGRLLFLGIEGADFSPGSGLTPAVAAAVESVVRLAVEWLKTGR